MTLDVKHFFVNGNTARGLTSFLLSSLQDISRLWVVDGWRGSAQNHFIKELGDDIAGFGRELWVLHCASDNDAIDGWIAPGMGLGMVTAEAFRTMKEVPTGIAIRFIQLYNTDLNPESAAAIQERISDLKDGIRRMHELAYEGYAEALRIHDDWEALYISCMDFDAADQLADEYIKRLYGDRILKKRSRVYRRFLGAATPEGAVDYVPSLTDSLKRYLVKGRAGTGKSTLLKKIAAEGKQRGFDVEIYHCGFDPSSVDMVIVRELGFAIFDSTAPHEYFANRPGDEVVDTYARCIAPGTDERYADRLAQYKAAYAAKMKESTQCLAEAKIHLDRLKEICAPLTDTAKLDGLLAELRQDIFKGDAASYIRQ